MTDLKTQATFPTTHPLHPFAAGLYVSGEAGAMVREADVILSLDWIDLGGSLRQACGGQFPGAKIIQCSQDSYLHNGWSKDYQALPPADVLLLANPDRLVDALLTHLPKRRDAPAAVTARVATRAPASAPAKAAAPPGSPEGRTGLLARRSMHLHRGHGPRHLHRARRGATVRTSACLWAGRASIAASRIRSTSSDSTAAAGSARGRGMAVGAALALKGSGRLPVAVLGDGDYLMGLTALWTGVHYRVPLLVLVSNNQSFFNDELHQERMARVRGRPVENRWSDCG